MRSPSPELIRTTRHQAGLTQTEAAELIDKALKTWQNWESEPGTSSHRKMDTAYWELFLLKLGKRH